MAVELVMAGAGRPMNHMAHHNLESLFYVLLGISVIYDEPYQLKSEAELMKCFDIYFNTFQLSLLKTITIQSQLGWLANILEHISPYFCPLIPLFEVLHQKIIKLPIILPMTVVNHLFNSSNPITHDYMIRCLLSALSELPGIPPVMMKVMPILGKTQLLLVISLISIWTAPHNLNLTQSCH
ncbi:hypothetical protein V8B97DRAFT_1876512 [Scleroderma yunnanense]